MTIGLVDVELHRFRSTILSVVDPTAPHHVLHSPTRVEPFRQLSVRALRSLFASLVSWDAKSVFVGLLLVSDTSTGVYRSSFTAIRQRFSMGYLRSRRVIEELVNAGYLAIHRDHLGTTFEILEMPTYLVAPRTGNAESRILASEIAVRYGISVTSQLLGILQRCSAGGISGRELLGWLERQGPLVGAKSPTAVVISRLSRLNRDLKRSPYRKVAQQPSVDLIQQSPITEEPALPVLLHDLERKDHDQFVRFVSQSLPVLPDPSTLGLSHHMSRRPKLCAATIEALCWSIVASADGDSDHGHLLQTWAHQTDPEHCPPATVALVPTSWSDSVVSGSTPSIASRYESLMQ